MTEEELIVKQQILIEELKLLCQRNDEIINDIKYYFTGIGQPLNDNVLKFNSEQLRWCYNVFDKINEFESIND